MKKVKPRRNTRSSYKKWDVTHYEHIAKYFREVPGLDRETLKNMQ